VVVPTEPFYLMNQVYRKVFPTVHQELAIWKERAKLIPNQELRKQATDSLEQKSFHCEGGGIMALLALKGREETIHFIVAYQTISDYLDNLCDRSTSLDPEDFACLHEAMEDALTVGTPLRNYYRCRKEQDDGGYLGSLVLRCQSVLAELDTYDEIKNELLELCRYYCDLQIHKHVHQDQREHRLQNWFQDHHDRFPEMEWYEFSACTGSTLGIFCLVAYAHREDFDSAFSATIQKGYFPYVQGLHILLDYLIDQEEDLAEGDLNFCFYYPNHELLFERLQHFVKEADRHTNQLPHKKFHQLINRGLLGVYLSDDKVNKQKNVRQLARKIIRSSGAISYFFYLNGRAYRTVQKWIPSGLIAKKL